MLLPQLDHLTPNSIMGVIVLQDRAYDLCPACHAGHAALGFSARRLTRGAEELASLAGTCVDRLAGGGDTTISREMEREPIRGDHQVEIRDDQGRISMAKISLRFLPDDGPAADRQAPG